MAKGGGNADADEKHVGEKAVKNEYICIITNRERGEGSTPQAESELRHDRPNWRLAKETALGMGDFFPAVATKNGV